MGVSRDLMEFQVVFSLKGSWGNHEVLKSVSGGLRGFHDLSLMFTGFRGFMQVFKSVPRSLTRF